MLCATVSRRQSKIKKRIGREGRRRRGSGARCLEKANTWRKISIINEQAYTALCLELALRCDGLVFPGESHLTAPQDKLIGSACIHTAVLWQTATGPCSQPGCHTVITVHVSLEKTSDGKLLHFLYPCTLESLLFPGVLPAFICALAPSLTSSLTRGLGGAAGFLLSTACLAITIRDYHPLCRVFTPSPFPGPSSSPFLPIYATGHLPICDRSRAVTPTLRLSNPSRGPASRASIYMSPLPLS